MRKRLFLWLRILFGLLIALFLLTLLASTPRFQNMIAQRLITDLSSRYGFTLSIDAVRVNPLSLNATVQHVLIPDPQRGYIVVYTLVKRSIRFFERVVGRIIYRTIRPGRNLSKGENL